MNSCPTTQRICTSVPLFFFQGTKTNVRIVVRLQFLLMSCMWCIRTDQCKWIISVNERSVRRTKGRRQPFLSESREHCSLQTCFPRQDFRILWGQGVRGVTGLVWDDQWQWRRGKAGVYWAGGESVSPTMSGQASAGIDSCRGVSGAVKLSREPRLLSSISETPGPKFFAES